jgi:2'-5' RNA ligase
MRLFLALKPDRPAEARLAERLLQLQNHLGEIAASLRWTPASNIHATLHFLGEMDPARARTLREALGSSIAEDPLLIEVGAAAVFPVAGAPRVVWLDIVRGAPEIGAVHAELGRRLAGAGFPLESRPFSPHLTVARVPDRERARTKQLRERLLSAPSMAIDWLADRVTLFRSDLSGSVPRYEPLHEIELATSPAPLE